MVLVLKVGRGHRKQLRPAVWQESLKKAKELLVKVKSRYSRDYRVLEMNAKNSSSGVVEGAGDIRRHTVCAAEGGAEEVTQGIWRSSGDLE